MMRRFFITFATAAMMLAFDAPAEAQVGPNNPNAPRISGVSVMRPDFSMRPPRSFRDPEPATRAAQTANPSFEELWSRFFASVSGYDRQASVNNIWSSSAPRTVSRRHVRRAGRAVAGGR